MHPFYDISGLCRRSNFIEVKGTYFYSEAFNAMFAHDGTRERQEFFTPVTLVPEPDNSHSKSGDAISVRWDGRTIGHLPSGTSTECRQIGRVAASGFTALTIARVWATTRSDAQRGYWVSVALPEPELFFPTNNPPAEPWTLLPGGSVSQVTKETDHRDVLNNYLPQQDSEHILVSLHLMPWTSRRTWDAIEVYLEGQRVGEVTSAKYASTLRHFDTQGLLSVSRATIDRTGEVKLFAAAADLPNPCRFQNSSARFSEVLFTGCCCSVILAVIPDPSPAGDSRSR